MYFQKCLTTGHLFVVRGIDLALDALNLGKRAVLVHLVIMQTRSLLEQFGQPFAQGLQRDADLADPLGQRGARQWHALARADLLDPVQRQVIGVFTHRHPGQQARCCHAAVNDRRRHRCCDDRLAGAASVLRTNVAMYEEAHRLHVELFADVFTDLDQALAACRALAQLRLMAVLDARKFGRQRLAPGTVAFALAGFAVTGQQVAPARPRRASSTCSESSSMPVRMSTGWVASQNDSPCSFMPGHAAGQWKAGGLDAYKTIPKTRL